MKKKNITISILAVLVLILFISSWLFFTSSVPLKYRFYSDDRITEIFIMTVNGIGYDLVEKILEYENTGTQRLHNSALKTSLLQLKNKLERHTRST